MSAVLEGHRYAGIFEREVLGEVERALGPEGAEHVQRASRTYAVRVAIFVGRCAAMGGGRFDPVAALLVGAIAPLYDGLFDARGAAGPSSEELTALAGLFDGELEAGVSVPEPLLSVFRLAEARLPRAASPGTYAALARLHRAQILAGVQRTGLGSVDDALLRTCTEAKGRAATELLASVVWGAAEDGRREQLGEFGYFLQLMDDWDDEGEDQLAGLETLVTRKRVSPRDILRELQRAAPLLLGGPWAPVAAHRFCAGLFWWWAWLRLTRGLGIEGAVRWLQRNSILEILTRLS